MQRYQGMTLILRMSAFKSTFDQKYKTICRLLFKMDLHCCHLVTLSIPNIPSFGKHELPKYLTKNSSLLFLTLSLVSPSLSRTHTFFFFHSNSSIYHVLPLFLFLSQPISPPTKPFSSPFALPPFDSIYLSCFLCHFSYLINSLSSYSSPFSLSVLPHVPPSLTADCRNCALFVNTFITCFQLSASVTEAFVQTYLW